MKRAPASRRARRQGLRNRSVLAGVGRAEVASPRTTGEFPVKQAVVKTVSAALVALAAVAANVANADPNMDKYNKSCAVCHAQGW